MCGILAYLHFVASDKQHSVDTSLKHEQDFDAIKVLVDNRGPDNSNTISIPIVSPKNKDEDSCSTTPLAILRILASTLFLRGPATPQPLVDSRGNVLAWNGEIFGGGIEVKQGENDTLKLLQALERCESDQDIMNTMALIDGPWAFIYWQASRSRLWFGRDRLGRRSLLINKKSGKDRLVLASAAPIPQQVVINPSNSNKSNDDDEASNNNNNNQEGAVAASPWEELPITGLFSVSFTAASAAAASSSNNDNDNDNDTTTTTATATNSEDGDGGRNDNHNYIYTITEHPWHSYIEKPFIPKREQIVPPADLNLKDLLLDSSNSSLQQLDELYATRFLEVLNESVRRRVASIPPLMTHNNNNNNSGSGSAMPARLAILFSGGIDSIVLAALADRHIPIDEGIDLINVAFAPSGGPDDGDDGSSSSSKFDAPDRITGRHGLAELRSLSPKRPWRFIEVNVTQEELEQHRAHIWNLVHPRCEHVMFFNLGAVLWFGTRGRGILGGSGSGGRARRNHHHQQQKQKQRHQGARYAAAPLATMSSTTTTTTSGDGGVAQERRLRQTVYEVKPRENLEVVATKFGMTRHRLIELNALPADGSIYSGQVLFVELEEKQHEQEVQGATTAITTATTSVATSVLAMERLHIEQQQQIDGDNDEPPPPPPQREDEVITVETQARVILVGAGSDEQLAGYGRHRSLFQETQAQSQSSCCCCCWEALQSELNKDFSNLWLRNLGRDDRCISDWGREARFPYLDEDVVRFLNSVPLWHVANLNQPPGIGDKKLLRMVARSLKLTASTFLVKRAMQFGTQIAKLQKIPNAPYKSKKQQQKQKQQAQDGNNSNSNSNSNSSSSSNSNQKQQQKQKKQKQKQRTTNKNSAADTTAASEDNDPIITDAVMNIFISNQ